jgi:hypothetical protein
MQFVRVFVPLLQPSRCQPLLFHHLLSMPDDALTSSAMLAKEKIPGIAKENTFYNSGTVL